jgi:hypothetical protein
MCSFRFLPRGAIPHTGSEFPVSPGIRISVNAVVPRMYRAIVRCWSEIPRINVWWAGRTVGPSRSLVSVALLGLDWMLIRFLGIA